MGATVIPGENSEREGQPGMNPGLLSVRCLLTKEPGFTVRGMTENKGGNTEKYVLVLEEIRSHRRFQSKEVTGQNLS